jgi:hypothetical protein
VYGTDRPLFPNVLSVLEFVRCIQYEYEGTDFAG